MEEKTKQKSGADETTPSVAQYFSWINSTNEGSTEAQTLINLDYFKWLFDKYGMKLQIYAWDAGNLDGANRTYRNPLTDPRLKKQYPRGYKPVVDKAAEFGCRMGVWAGPDGFGDEPDEINARRELIVSLCRDLNFRQFKFDGVGGYLRQSKQKVFHEMIDECRKYTPDLIVLNHRIDMGEAEVCATTFLWEGTETYVDVHMFNTETAPHHRAAALKRGLVPGLKRLTEDHGVCLSSCLDYFDDDMIMEAFSRSLILAPETYGNPWFLRDSEQLRYAKIYNMHRKFNDILVCGMELPEKYGKYAVSRGDGSTRLVVMQNSSWNKTTVTVSVSREIGIEDESKEYIVKTLHPYESYVGTYNYGDAVDIDVMPFRAALVLFEEKEKFMQSDFVLTNCKYETSYNDTVNEAYIYSGNGEKIEAIGNISFERDGVSADSTVKAPVFLGKLNDIKLPENTKELYEATAFSADCDSFEAQSIKRSGDTDIPQVRKARDAFFGQETYKARGCEARFMFDGKQDTYFDANSKTFETRIDGGCLRVDFGKTYKAAKLTIDFFEIDEPVFEVHAQSVPENGSFGCDLSLCGKAKLVSVTEKEDISAPVVCDGKHFIRYHKGKKKTAVYLINGEMRYFKLPLPPDRIYDISLLDENGNKIALASPRANNLLSPNKNFVSAKKCTVRIPENSSDGSYIALCINGNHGVDGVYCAAEHNGELLGAFDRAISYPVNNWEYITNESKKGYTYYFKAEKELSGEEITLYALFTGGSFCECEAWFCDGYDKTPVCRIEW